MYYLEINAPLLKTDVVIVVVITDFEFKKEEKKEDTLGPFYKQIYLWGNQRHRIFIKCPNC